MQQRCGLSALPGVANFVLCFAPPDGPDAAEVVKRCRADGLFIRDVGNMGAQLGDRALRIAVKDAATNRRIVNVLAHVICGTGL